MDKLDRLYERKKFFMALYQEALGDGNNLKENQHIRVFQKNDNFSKVSFFFNVDDLNNYIENNRYNANTYFTLGTTDGEYGTNENLMYRYCLAWDFDKKDFDKLDSKDIMFFFKSIGLWFHALIDSGNGYHAYMFIEKTNDFAKVEAITKAIGEKLGADEKAMLSTQILRIPYSFNVKNDKPKQVNIIKLFEKDTIKRYCIDDLYKRFCVDNNTNEQYKNIQHAFNTLNIVPCVQSILNNGSLEGERNSNLQKIIVTLRRMNKDLKEIHYICNEWNSKCTPSMNEHELKYQVEYIYENVDRCSYDCKDCANKGRCFAVVESDFFHLDETLLTMSESVIKYCKKSRKGVRDMTGNELLIYSTLKLHEDGLYTNEIVKEITYKGKARLSEPTLIKTLKELLDDEFIICKRDKQGNFYKINDVKSKIELTYTVGYSATLSCIKKDITTDELRLYNYMRYLQHKQQREGTTKLKGNLFQIDQRDLANDLGTSQCKISNMIKNLINEKLVSIWYRGKSKNNQYDFNIYRLNI